MKSEAINIFLNFLGAIKAVNYYPPRHPSRTQPVTRAHQLLKPLLARKNRISIAVVEDVLVFEGEPFYDDSTVLELFDILTEREIADIRLQKGLTEDELSVLVEILSADRAAMEAFGPLEQYLQTRSVTHVEIVLREEDIREKAKKVYSDAKNFIVDIMKEDRVGAVPKGEKAFEITKGLQDIILQDKDAILGLTLLSDYDNYTFNHSVNVGVFSLALAQELGYSHDEALLVGLTGLLHDVGKCRVPIEIINKPGKLSDDEWKIMQSHPVESAKILKQMGSAIREEAVVGVLTHHVRHDHNGYPKWDKPLLPNSELTSVGDCYDSMTTLRPYQKRFEPSDAIAVMQRISGSVLHASYVDVFIKMLGMYPVGSVVRLNTNEIGLVFGMKKDAQELPTVKIIMDRHGNYLTEPEVVDLSKEHSRTNGISRRIVTTIDPSLRNIDVARFL
jgi:putative nucleotidyltransferase with HDIG domain